MIATRQVIALRPRRPTLALLTARQLFKAPVQLFDLPAHVTGIFRHLRCHGLIQILGNDPVKVAVWGDQLEQPHLEGYFLQLDEHPVDYSIRRPLQLFQMDLPLLFAQTHQSSALQCGEEGPCASVNQLQIFGRRVPPVKQDRPRLDLLLVDSVDEHLVEMIVFSLAIDIRGIDPIINRVEVLVFACTRHQTDDPNPSHDSMLIATVLGAHQLHEPGVGFILHAGIHQEKGVLTIFKPVFDQPPYLPGQEAFLTQKIVDHVMTHALQVFGQVRTGAVLRRTHQILHILLLGNHDRNMLFSSLKRKSCTGTSGGAEITSAVTAGTYTVSNLAAGANRIIRAVITVARNTAPNTIKDCLVTSTSAADTTKRDAVKARVTVP